MNESVGLVEIVRWAPVFSWWYRQKGRRGFATHPPRVIQPVVNGQTFAERPRPRDNFTKKGRLRPINNKRTHCSRGCCTNTFVINSVSDPFPPNFQIIITPKPVKLEIWNFERMFTPHHVSCVTFNMSHDMCHLSCVTCQVSHATSLGVPVTASYFLPLPYTSASTPIMWWR